jgi:hypothetical protein
MFTTSRAPRHIKNASHREVAAIRRAGRRASYAWCEGNVFPRLRGEAPRAVLMAAREHLRMMRVCASRLDLEARRQRRDVEILISDNAHRHADRASYVYRQLSRLKPIERARGDAEALAFHAERFLAELCKRLRRAGL